MVKIRGGEFKQALKVIEAKLLDALPGSVALTAKAIEGGAKSRAPVRTGKLRASIKAETVGLKGKVSTGVFYAAHVEFGTTFQRAQPYMRPTAEAEREAFVKRVKEAVWRVAR